MGGELHPDPVVQPSQGIPGSESWGTDARDPSPVTRMPYSPDTYFDWQIIENQNSIYS